MGAFDDFPSVTIPENEEQRKVWGWDSHEQVVIKGVVDISDQEYITNLMGSMSKKGDIEIRMGTGRFSLLDRMILSWTLTRNGQIVPLTPSTIRKLPSAYATPILETIDRITGRMTEAEQADFLTSANGHIVDSDGSGNLSLMKS